MTFLFRKKVALPPETVFAFFQNPSCLQFLHRRNVRLLRHDDVVHVGSETWVELTTLKILPIVLGFRHNLFEPPHRFGETIIHGPFERFDHIHEFATLDGGTEIIDHLQISLPRCFGGELSMRRFISPAVAASFAARHCELDELIRTGKFLVCATKNLKLSAR